MSRTDIVEIALSLEWKQWGNLRLYKHSYYQCFRRANEYIWIGLRYIERSTNPIALDYVGNPEKVHSFLA